MNHVVWVNSLGTGRNFGITGAVTTLRFYYVRHRSINVVRAAVCPRPSTRLLPKPQLTDDHAAVGRLAHVIDRERSDGARVKRFHLHARAVNRVDVGLDGDLVVEDLEVDVDGADEQRMAQRDHVRRALGRLDAGDAGDGEHVTLFDLTVGDGRGGLGLHHDDAARNGATMRRLLGCDVDHPGASEWVQMGE